MKAKRVAIVYDRVNKWGGAERVLLSLLQLFPNATLFTSVYSPQNASWARQFKKIQPSFLQKIAYARRNHEYFALLMPMAFESFDFSQYDLVISVTSESAKGIITGPNTIHICYCLTPTRYLWSGQKTYFDSKFKRMISSPALSYLRKWDKIASTRPDEMIGISTEVTRRINRYYGRKSELIFPPVEVDTFSKVKKKKKNYFLIVSRLVKYKKVDLAIKALNQLNKKLIVVGTGREEKYLKRIARKNITFISNISDDELKVLYTEAKALIFPQCEDFGLVAVEAMASDTPIIAYQKGGSKDIVLEGRTGIFFHKQTTDSLISAVKVFETMKFDSNELRNHARTFSKQRFLTGFATMVNKAF